MSYKKNISVVLLIAIYYNIVVKLVANCFFFNGEIGQLRFWSLLVQD